MLIYLGCSTYIRVHSTQDYISRDILQWQDDNVDSSEGNVFHNVPHIIRNWHTLKQKNKISSYIDTQPSVLNNNLT